MLHARRGHQFIEGDDGAGANLVDGAAHAEFLQHALQHLGVLLEGFLVDGADALLRLGQDAERGQVEAVAGFELEGLLVGVAGGTGRLDGGDPGLGGAGGAARGRRRDGGDGGGVFPRRDRGAGRLVVGIGIGGVGIVLGRMVGGRGFRLGHAARLARRGSSGGLGDDAGVALEPGF
ncbi:hypothetical protein D3C71_1553910 [compost metagenome]